MQYDEYMNNLYIPLLRTWVWKTPMAPLSVLRGGASLDIPQYAAWLMQKQCKVMASAVTYVTLVNLDMKGVVRSRNVEQAVCDVNCAFLLEDQPHSALDPRRCNSGWHSDIS